MPPRIFISYRHHAQDEPWLDQLCAQLKVLALEGAYQVWHDRELRAGDDFEPAIAEAVDAADVALLLISADFFGSSYIREKELPRLLERRERGRVRIVPLILRPCAWQRVPWLRGLEARPKSGPLSSLSANDAEQVLADLAVEIADLHREPEAPAPAAPAGPASPAYLRARDLFVGRRRELDALAQALLPREGTPTAVGISAVSGMGGVGKSYLVDRLYEQHIGHFQGGYIRLALDPERPVDSTTLLAELAGRLDIEGEAATIPQRLRERLRTPPTLVHLENVDTPEAVPTARELAILLQGCALCITGRVDRLELGGLARPLALAEFDTDEALALLREEFRFHAAAPPPEAEARRLVTALGGLPLAIYLAAGYMSALGLGSDAFLEMLREADLNLEPYDPGDSAEPERRRRVLSETFSASLRVLAERLNDPALYDSFLALGYAPAGGFGLSLGAALAGQERGRFLRIMARAQQLSLVQPLAGGPGTARWRVHPLLAARLRARCDPEAPRERLGRWFFDHLDANEGDRPERWGRLDREPEALAEWLAAQPVAAIPLIERAAREYAERRGPYRLWLQFLQRGLAAEPKEPEQRSNLLWTLSGLALRTGEMGLARTAAEEQRGLDRERGEEREAALASGRLADILQARGELDEALRIRTEEELPVYERLGDVRSKAVTQGQIADILQARGELDEALRIFREEVLPAFERLGDVRHMAVLQGRIADILQARGELDEALRILTEEQLPACERLGDVRGLLAGRANTALTLLARQAPGDREAANDYLCMALTAALRLRIPAAGQVAAILLHHQMRCEAIPAESWERLARELGEAPM